MAGPSQFLKLRGTDEQSSRVQDNINGTLGPIAQALSATPIMGAPAPSWIRPALSATLVDAIDSIGGTWARAGYHRNALGYVWGKGKLIATAGFGAAGTLWTLPLEYRPAETLTFAVEGSGAAQFIRVQPNGAVVNVLAIGVNGSIDCDLHFLAEQ